MRIHVSKQAKIWVSKQGQSEFARNTFLVSSGAATYREGSGLMHCDTFAASLPTTPLHDVHGYRYFCFVPITFFDQTKGPRLSYVLMTHFYIPRLTSSIHYEAHKFNLRLPSRVNPCSTSHRICFHSKLVMMLIR